MIPKNITKDDIHKAIEEIDRVGLRKKQSQSSAHDLLYQANRYPPKYVVMLANEFANKQMLGSRDLNTSQAQAYLVSLSTDFKIVPKSEDPLRMLIERYKEKLADNGMDISESYKWKLLQEYGGRPDTNASDFSLEIMAIPYANLIFKHGLAVKKHISESNGEQYRQSFKILFDQQIDLQERIEKFQEHVLQIYRSMNMDLPSHHDERTIATFLAVKYPQDYAFYKHSFYSKLCKLKGISTESAGRKYVHYLGELNSFIKQYILTDPTLLDLVSKNLPEGSYADPNHKLLAQDILYTMLDKDIISFTGTIDELRISMAESETILKDFTIDKTKDKGINGKKDTFAWIRDGSKIIGNLNAHYEISVRNRWGKMNQYFVDVHFEGSDKGKYEKIITEPLPTELDWFIWLDDTKSIGCTTAVDPADPNAVEQLMDLLIHLETSIGDRIREVMPQKYVLMAEKPLFGQPLNQILYGPPGTGKTYHTVDKALEIVDPEFYKKHKENRKELTKRFRDLLIRDFEHTSGQIAFCTFHQSMAYEDFVEGIKPVPPRTIEETVNYQIADGLFKKICMEATKSKSVLGFDDAYEKFINDLIEDDNRLILHTPKLNKPFNIRVNSNHNVVAIPQTVNATEMVVTKSMIKNYMLHGIVDDWKSYTVAISDYIKANYTFSITDQDNSMKNYVLIIDEINRGNVSQIFGELITLIEDNKRFGEKESLEIILPYSAMSFSVPKNLYIIGTMNTADRSIEALDSALRRRFSFEEMQPNTYLLSPARMVWQLWWQYEKQDWTDGEYLKRETSLYNLLGATGLQQMSEKDKDNRWERMKKNGEGERVFNDQSFTGLNLQAMLETINLRLEKLLSSDHSIGHSYLMEVCSMDDLSEAVYNKIIPLLQEYFYGDLGKIGLVMGKGFIRAKPQSTSDIFADFEYETDMLSEKIIYEILDYREQATYGIKEKNGTTTRDFAGAIQQLLGSKNMANG